MTTHEENVNLYRMLTGKGYFCVTSAVFMRLLTYLAIAILFSLARQIQAQGLTPGILDGFMKGQRKASLAIIASQESFDTYYINKTETKNPNLGTVTTQALTVVGTYGLGYDLDLIVTAPYIRTEASAGYSPKQEGLQDISATLRWEAFDYKLGKTRLSWLFAAGTPCLAELRKRCVCGYRAWVTQSGWPHHAALQGSALFSLRVSTATSGGQVTLDHVVNYYDPSQLNPNSGMKVNVPDVTELIIRTGSIKKRYKSGCVGPAANAQS